MADDRDAALDADLDEDTLDAEDATEDEDGQDDAQAEETGDAENADRGEEDDEGKDDRQAGRSREVDDRPRRKSASERIRELRADRQRVERERDLERDRATRAEQAAFERQRVNTEAEERERVALMGDSERFEYYRQKDRQEHAAEMHRFRMDQAERDDRADFRALQASDPVARKWASEVETQLQVMRSKGQNLAREALLDYLVGKDLRAKAGKATDKAKQRGAASVRRNASRAGGGRSDTGSDRGKRGQTSEERLEGKFI